MIQDTIYFFRCKWLQRLSFDLFSDALVAKSIFQFIVRCYGFGDYISILISCAIGLQRQSVFPFFLLLWLYSRNYLYSYFQVLWLQKLYFILISRCYGCRNYLLFLFPGATVVEAIPGFSVSHLTRVTLSRAPR